MLTEALLEVTLIGSEWVLYLLIFLSVVSVAVMVERAIYFRRNAAAWAALSGKVAPVLRGGDLRGLSSLLGAWAGSEAEVLRAGLEGAGRGRESAERMVHAALVTEQQRLERRLSILGTLGNNAPFIGLFGTVLGIIRAFHDLSLDVKGGASVVMTGISEALIATAAGLFVAIPAVIAYNYFQRRTARAIAQAQAAADTLIAFMPAGETGRDAAAS
ncbi:MAG: MotA/TolQ/ExbB proton channel family protein [Deltaproteobacteria bacterium]|nr:MotA/TolQ/ExbB proton channel family protein [Deltaproteobacteria bacterium]